MRIEKEDLSVQEAAGRDQVHVSITRVCIEEGLLVATDGRILSAREIRKEEGEAFESFLLDAKALKNLRGAGTLEAGTNGCATFRAESGVEINLKKQEETFPQWRRVMPNPEGKETKKVMLSVEYLTRLLKTFKGVDQIELEIIDEETAVSLTGKTPDGRKVQGVIMPCVLR